MITMGQNNWRIYLGKIPYRKKGNYWVSFESDRSLKKTKANIYGRCLPCIYNLYTQLKAGRREITLGTAYHCWKVTAPVNGIDEGLSLLSEFEKKFPTGHVYGKLGSGRTESRTKVVVFHTETKAERDRIKKALKACLPAATGKKGEVKISRACAMLYDDILGDWQEWRPRTPIKHPENKGPLLARIKKILYTSEM